MDGQRYPRDSVLINYKENDYIEQHDSSKLFSKEYIGEPIINSFTSYPHMEPKYSIEKIDLRYQPDHMTPKKSNNFMNMVLILRMLDYF